LINSEYSAQDTIKVLVELKNTGNLAGDEVVQLYLRHPDSEVPVPVHALAGFRRIHLEKGEKRTVEFSLDSRELAVISDQNERIVLPGKIELYAGGQQPDEKSITEEKAIKAEFRLVGEPYLIDRLDK
jgi:beta-glucosidase